MGSDFLEQKAPESFERKEPTIINTQPEFQQKVLIYFDENGQEYIDKTAAKELNIRIYDKISFSDSFCGTITQIYKETIKKIRQDGYAIEYRMISLGKNFNYNKNDNIIDPKKQEEYSDNNIKKGENLYDDFERQDRINPKEFKEYANNINEEEHIDDDNHINRI